MRIQAPGSDVKFSTALPRFTASTPGSALQFNADDAVHGKHAPADVTAATPNASVLTGTRVPSAAEAAALGVLGSSSHELRRELDATAEYNALLRVLLAKLRPPAHGPAPPQELIAVSIARLAKLPAADMVAMQREASSLTDYGSVLRLVLKRLEHLAGGEVVMPGGGAASAVTAPLAASNARKIAQGQSSAPSVKRPDIKGKPGSTPSSKLSVGKVKDEPGFAAASRSAPRSSAVAAGNGRTLSRGGNGGTVKRTVTASGSSSTAPSPSASSNPLAMAPIMGLDSSEGIPAFFSADSGGVVAGEHHGRGFFIGCLAAQGDEPTPCR